MSRDHWDKNAANWAAWARKPGFDSYWQYAKTFFELVPPPGERTLEVGCGEGRVSRDLAARGHHVFAVDTSQTLIQLAHDTDASIAYVRCDAAALPFQGESFDLIVFYNSLMDFDDMDASVAEAGRVLRPGGAFCAAITHPLQDAGRFASRNAGAPFVIEGAYLGDRRVVDAELERDGLHMHFKGWAYPLEAYARAMENAGLMIQALREPAMDSASPSIDPSVERWRRIPVFLMWRAIKA